MKSILGCPVLTTFSAALLLLASGPGFAGVVAHWTFDGHLDDDGPGGFEAELVGPEGPRFVTGAAGADRGALDFNGMDEHAELLSGAGLPAQTRPRHSIAFWVRGEPQDDALVLVEQSSESSALLALGPEPGAAGPRLAVRIVSASGELLLDATSSRGVFDGHWHHVAWVDDTGIAALFIDGERDPRDFIYERTEDDLDLTLLAAREGEVPESHFEGAIDDVWIFDHALELEEVRELLPLDGCPAAGDTHCTELQVEGPGLDGAVGESGLYLLIAAGASDDSGDDVLYTFTATRGGSEEAITVGPLAENIAEVELGPGEWVLSVEVDDDLLCPDRSVDARCSRVVSIASACPTEGDTHCGELDVRGPSTTGPGRWFLEAIGATDDSGDTILYTFRATSAEGRELSIGPRTDPLLELELGEDVWMFSVEVDDDPLCPDRAPDAICEVEVRVDCPAEGDTHCDGLEARPPRDDGLVTPGVYTAVVISGTDDSGDVVLYDFFAQSGRGDRIPKSRLQTTAATFILSEGLWQIDAHVDDDPACFDRTPDDTCSIEFTVERAPPEMIARWALDRDFFGEGPAGTTGEFLDDEHAPFFTEGADGTVEGAWLADGNLDGVALPLGPGLPMYAHHGKTIAFWLKAEPQAGAHIYSEVALEEDSLFALGTDPNTPSGRLAVRLRGTNGVEVLSYRLSATVVLDGTWHHIAWVDEGGDARLFVDGELDATNFAYKPPLIRPDSIALGCLVKTDPAGCFSGALDDVRLFTYALPQEEVRALAGLEPEEVIFRRGDSNDDASLDIADAVFILRYLFLGAGNLSCMEAADANDDGRVDIADAVRILGFLFLGGEDLPVPSSMCGTDGPGSPDLGCDEQVACLDG